MSLTSRGVLLTLLLFLVVPSWAATLCVVYPTVRAPHNQIFDQIIDGIEKEFDGDVKLVLVPQKYKIQNIVDKVEAQKPDMVITLGKTGFKIARLLKGKIPLVNGALAIRPNSVSGISPVADPTVMFTYLKQLVPNITRVSVVYSPRTSQWLVDLAKAQAKQSGITLSAYPVKDIPSAIRQYSTLMNSIDNAKEAFWLPMDPVSANKKVVNRFLEEAWEKHFVVFSSKPRHTKNGALFALMPDNRAQGSSLVKMVSEMFKGATDLGVRPSSVVQLAVNLRTASHLGLEYTTKQKGQFNLIYSGQ